MLKQIKYFQSVVCCKSFTQAAEECYISQSAISQQIQALEQEIGVKLLNRENRKFSLTPAGEYFYRKSLVLTADFEKICSETVRISNEGYPQLRIGYLRCYGGLELHYAIAEFTAKYPDVSLEILNGNHEDLYNLLRVGGVDLVFNDQRRAFSDEYINFHLTTSNCYIEISRRNPIAQLELVNVEDIKETPCILVASKEQQHNEKEYYREIVGINTDFLFAENLEEGRLMVAGNKGVMPVEGGKQTFQSKETISRIPLYRNNKPIKRNYCAFWKTDNADFYVEEFANILKAQFLSEV